MEDNAIKEAIRRAGMSLDIVNPEHALPVTVGKFILESKAVEEPVKEEVKEESFKWEDSLRLLSQLMKTGRPVDPKPLPTKKKTWKWLDKQVEEEKKISQTITLPPVDFSDTGLKSFETELQVEPRPTKVPLKTDSRGKFLSKSVRLMRNGITSMTGLDTFLEERFADPSNIEWLDLSYNAISEIDPVLSMLPNLKMLYLHSNCIDDLDEVRRLRYLPNLRSLTLFGNPIEAIIDYRLKIIAAIPTIKRIDWTIITPRERVLAKRYESLMEEKDKEEAKELERQEKAAAERREKKLKAAEKRKRRKQEQKEGKDHKPEPELENKMELDFEPKVKKEMIAAEKEPSLEEVIEEISEEEVEEEITEELELDKGIVPISLADLGPLDFKGKYKLHPDSLSTESLIEDFDIESSTSEISLFSTESVTIEQIRNEFNALKALEPNADHNWGGSFMRF